MSREARYQVFLDQCTKLAKTLLVKSELTISAMNKYIQQYYGISAVNTLDPGSWKYYMNIAGEYHFLDTDMTVVSMDTLETIDFTVENLRIHTSTARAYAYGTRQYQELVNRYPTQERLILGILYPVDKDMAIAAKDFTILGYPEGLVEPNEYTLIERLQKWLYGYQLRWTNTQYAFSDNLYVAQNLGLMHLYSLGAIISQRWEACKTIEAHSYHVRQFLTSRGLSDSQVDQLTLGQSLWLYRNLDYILLNQGKQETLELLINHIMTERNLPLVSFSMRHNVSGMPESLVPDITFKAKKLNDINTIGGTDNLTLHQLLTKEGPLARNNLIERDDNETSIHQAFVTSKSGVVQTKVLECSVVDYTDSSPYSLADLLLTLWLDQAANGLYKTVVNITNPKNGELIPLFTKDAFCLMTYAFYAQYGFTLDTIPEFYGSRVPRSPVPSVDTLMTYVDKRLVDRSLITNLHNTMPVMRTTISIDAFYNQCKALYDVQQYQRNVIAYQEHMDARAYVEGAVNGLYCDKVYHLYPTDMTYERWFNSLNLNISDFTSVEYTALYNNILEQATGSSLHTSKSLKDMQAAMIGIMRQLSSYSVQFLSSINTSRIHTAETPMVRFGDSLFSTDSQFDINSVTAGEQDARITERNTTIIDVWVGNTDSFLAESAKSIDALEVPSLVHASDHGHESVYHYDIGAPQLSTREIYPPNDLGVVPKSGLDTYVNLSTDLKQAIAFDIWS